MKEERKVKKRSEEREIKKEEKTSEETWMKGAGKEGWGWRQGWWKKGEQTCTGKRA